jgi:integrase
VGIAGDAIDVAWDQFVKEEVELARGRISATGALRLETALNALTSLCAPATVGGVDFAMLERFVPERSKTCKPATVASDLGYIRSALRRAKKRGYVRDVPDLPRVNVPEEPLRVLSPTEVSKLMNACLDKRQKAFVWLSLTLGTRLSETLHIRWDDVSFEDRIVRIVCQDGWQPKARRNRVCYLDNRGVELLRALWDVAPKVVANGTISPKAPWVFMSETSERWGQNVQRTWRGLVKRAGIAHAGIHALRRTFVSGLVAAGVQQSIVTAVAGHSSPNTTFRYYTHLPSEVCREAVSRLPWVTAEDPERCANSAHDAVQRA